MTHAFLLVLAFATAAITIDEGAANPLAWLSERPVDVLAAERDAEVDWFLAQIGDMRRELLRAEVMPVRSYAVGEEMTARLAAFEDWFGCAPADVPRWDEVAASARALLDTSWTASLVDRTCAIFRAPLLAVAGDLDEALEAMEFDEAYMDGCGNAVAYAEVRLLEGRSCLAVLAGRSTEALELLEETDAWREYMLSPAAPRSLVRRGLLLVSTGRADEALPALQEVVDLSPRTRWSEIARAVLVHEGRFVEPTLERIVALDPPGRPTRPVVLAIGGHRFAGSFEWLSATRETDPGHLRALGLLGDERARPLLERLVREARMATAVDAFAALVELPGGARDLLPDLLARVAREGANGSDALDEALHRVLPDGPQLAAGASAPEQHAARWLAWLAERGDEGASELSGG
ncbi:MAG: hypothetical protein H6825_08480 [Planctomycetes bacterium]|nr:hypothetical protein [Planctomycetota bacterium]